MLGKTGNHAIKALAVLAGAEADTYLGAVAIAGRIGAPGNYLGKLLQSLARAGLVEGRKGLQGGFRLARPPERISLFDIAEPIERVSRWHECFLARGECHSGRPCPAHQRWAGVRKSYLNFLQKTTLKDVATGMEDFARSLAPAASLSRTRGKVSTAPRPKRS
jgi:Rrf2 family protein